MSDATREDLIAIRKSLVEEKEGLRREDSDTCSHITDTTESMQAMWRWFEFGGGKEKAERIREIDKRLDEIEKELEGNG